MPLKPTRRSCSKPKYSDRKSTRLNSSHSQISYAVFCLKKKTQDGLARRDVSSARQPRAELPHHSSTLGQREHQPGSTYHLLALLATHVKCMPLYSRDV